MNYGIDIATLGDYADARLVVRLAQAAEAAGWQGLQTRCTNSIFKEITLTFHLSNKDNV